MPLSWKTKPKAISSFTGEYRWLSNFECAFVQFDGWWYSSVEHAYQAAKTLNPAEREAIRQCKTPGRAKRMGRHVTLRPQWESIKQQVMLDLLRQKFRLPHFCLCLLSTGTAELIEGNDWGDTYWGWCQGRGQNILGKLLMTVRDELRKGDV